MCFVQQLSAIFIHTTKSVSTQEVQDRSFMFEVYAQLDSQELLNGGVTLPLPACDKPTQAANVILRLSPLLLEQVRANHFLGLTSKLWSSRI
jgi:hypothetical protein